MSEPILKLMGVTEYARYRGCDVEAVRKAIESGRIPFTFSGTRKMINPKEADESWEKNTDHNMNFYKKKNEDPSKLRAPAFQESRAIREAYHARILKLEYEKKKGKLIEVEKVKNRSIATAELIKQSLRMLPIKIAPMIAAETDIYKIELIILKEIDDALNHLAGYGQPGI